MRWVRITALLAVAGFLGTQLWEARHGVLDGLGTVGVGRAALAGALAIAGLVPGMLGWRALLAGMGTRLDVPTAGRVYFVAGLGKYLPGGLWPALAHADVARSLREPPQRFAAAFLGSVVLSIVAGLAVGMLAVPRLAATEPLWWLAVPALLLALVPIAAPGVVRASLATHLERAVLVRATALMALGWLVAGTHVSVLAVALGADLGTAVLAAGAFVLSALAGVVAFVLPAGLGAREVVLGVTLWTVLPPAAVITVVALSRVLVTVADVVSAGVAATVRLSSPGGRGSSRAASATGR